MPSTIGTLLTGLPARVFVRGFGSLRKIEKPKLQQAYANALASGLLSENIHNPLVRPLLERVIELTSDHETLTKRQQRFLNKEIMRDRAYRFQASDNVIAQSPEVFDFIWNRYKIDEAEIESWTKYCKNIPHFQCGLDHIVIDKCIEVDIEPLDNYQLDQTGLNTDFLISPIEEESERQ
jgi:hypothetical protein